MTNTSKGGSRGGVQGVRIPPFFYDCKKKKKIHIIGLRISGNAALCDICGDWLDHCSSPEHLVPVSVIPVFALNLSENPHISGVHPLAFCSL